MANYYDPPFDQGQTSRTGSLHYEARLIKLETHCWHESQARLAAEKRAQSDLAWIVRQLEAVRNEIEEVQADRAAMIMRVGAWLITSLVGALGLFAYDALKAGMGGG